MSAGRCTVIKIIRSGGGQATNPGLLACVHSFAIYDRMENLVRPVSKADLGPILWAAAGIGIGRKTPPFLAHPSLRAARARVIALMRG